VFGLAILLPQICVFLHEYFQYPKRCQFTHSLCGSTHAGQFLDPNGSRDL
jgi:hypothetical protein